MKPCVGRGGSIVEKMSKTVRICSMVKIERGILFLNDKRGEHLLVSIFGEVLLDKISE